MYEKYHEQGLEVIDIPCSEFCTLNYNTKFPQMKKSDVNGENELSLYTYLKAQKRFEGFGDGKTAQTLHDHITKSNPDYQNNSDIKWNFTKFVIARDGTVVARFEPPAPMSDVEACVAKLM